MGIESCLTNACREASESIELSAETVTQTDTIETNTDALTTDGYVTRNDTNNPDYQGEWDSATAYTADDVVVHEDKYYIATASTTNNEPPNTTYWCDMQVENLVSIPQPLLDLPMKSSLAMKRGVGNVELTRTHDSTHIATYTDRWGIVQYASDGEPRFEKNGLLLEGDGANTLQYTEDISNAYWGKGNSDVSTDSTEAPDRATTADTLIGDTATGYHSLTSGFQSVTSGEYYTASIYVKAKEYDQFAIQFRNVDTGGWRTAIFDLTLGEFVSSPSTVHETVERLDDGWFRISATVLCDATSTGSATTVFCIADGGSVSFAGANNTDGIYIWGSQFEESGFMTSYIPVEATTAMYRNEDIMTVTAYDNISHTNHETSKAIDLYIPSGISDVDIVIVNGYTNSYADKLRIFTSTSDILWYKEGVQNGNTNPDFIVDSLMRFVFTMDNDKLRTCYGDGVYDGSTTTTTTDYTDEYPTTMTFGDSGELYRYHVSNYKEWDFCMTPAQARLV